MLWHVGGSRDSGTVSRQNFSMYYICIKYVDIFLSNETSSSFQMWMNILHTLIAEWLNSSFPKTWSRCWNERVCQGVKCFLNALYYTAQLSKNVVLLTTTRLLREVFSHAAVTLWRILYFILIFTDISTAVHSMVLIYTAEWTGASWRERKCPNF